jgi:hypothetical protein
VRLGDEGVAVALVVRIEAVHLELFARHDLQGADAAEGLLGAVGQCRGALLDLAGRSIHAPGAVDRVERHEGERRQDQPGEFRREPEHGREAHRRAVDQDDPEQRARAHQAPDQADVRHGPGHHVADAVPAVEGHALALEAVEERLAQLEGDVEAGAADRDARAGDDHQACEDTGDDADDREQEVRVLRAAREHRVEAVDALAQEQRHGCLEEPGDEEQDQRGPDQCALTSEPGGEAPEAGEPRAGGVGAACRGGAGPLRRTRCWGPWGRGSRHGCSPCP